MTTDNVVTDNLISRLQACSHGQLTNGRLDIKDPQNQQHWSLYFHLGHLVGESGGVHPVRRWQRQLSQYCSHSINAVSSWNYDTLAELVRRKEIRREQMVAVVQDNIAEVLFDIIQREELQHSRLQAQLIYTFVPRDTLYPSPLVFIQVNQVLRQAQLAWSAWRQAGLVDYSLNMAPVIWQHEKLQQQISPSAYRSLTDLLDGKQTIRDLALKLKQTPLLLTQSILPYIRQGLMKLIEVPDLSNSGGERYTTVCSETVPATVRSQPTQPQSISPLVAYIDDSPRDSQIMGQIVTKAGHRYVNLQDSVLALPMLLEQKPHLIFLDLVMPVANGYEICAQIRRTSIFKDTPVIIVTGNDGIVDRVRAKIVRSTDFIAKPIATEKVLVILRKYLSVPNPVGFRSRNRQNA